MAFFLQDAADDFTRLGADVAGPAQEAFRRPAMHRLMSLRHMLLTGAMGPLTIAAWVTGHPLTLVADRHAAIRGLDFDGLLYQVVWYRVIVLVVLDVVIDMHTGLFDIGILVRLGRQGPQGRFVQLLELAEPGAGQLLEGALIEIIQQHADGLIE